MKSLVRHLQTLSSSSSSSSSSSCRRSLTTDEIAQINLLLPRLFLSSDRHHLSTATKLATAALLTNPPPNSVSFSPLLLSLASLPSFDTSLPMSLLTRLRHSHSPHLLPSATALAASYFRAAHPKLCSRRLRHSRAEETEKLTEALGRACGRKSREKCRSRGKRERQSCREHGCTVNPFRFTVQQFNGRSKMD